MLCAPAAAVMLLVTGYPVLYAVYLSLLRADLRFPDDNAWVGLNNYITVLTSGLWWADVGHTVFITVVSVAIELVLGMLLALVMHRALVGRGLVRTSALIPYGIVTVVAAFAWRFAWSAADGGFIPEVMGWTFDPTDLTHKAWNYVIVITCEVWKTTPFMALLLLAGLAQVSEDMLEAAQVDGATWWQRLYKVILPNMRAAIMVAVLFRALDAFRIFDSIYVMTRGAQDTESSSFLTYRQVIEQMQLGLGSALSVLLFISVLLLAFLIVRLFKVDLASARGEG